MNITILQIDQSMAPLFDWEWLHTCWTFVLWWCGVRAAETCAVELWWLVARAAGGIVELGAFDDGYCRIRGGGSRERRGVVVRR